MPITLTLQPEYGYVLLTSLALPLLSVIHGFHAGSFRRAAKVPLPNLYATPAQMDPKENPDTAEAAYRYNCAQRVHANYMDSMPQTFVLMLVAGVKYPVLSSVFGAAWAGFRVLFAAGYIYGSEKMGGGRRMGSGHWWVQLALLSMVAKMGLDLLSGA